MASARPTATGPTQEKMTRRAALRLGGAALAGVATGPAVFTPARAQGFNWKRFQGKELFFLGESGNLTGGTGTSSFRAYDKRNGKVIWETSLPTLVTGAPMTYMHKDRQYIVVAVSAAGRPARSASR